MKGGVREIRNRLRDPRAEQTEPRPSSVRPSAAGAPPAEQRPRGPSLDQVMRELSLDLPPPAPRAGTPAGFSKEPPAPAPSVRDPFGIVGTTQAETFAVESVVAHGGFGVIYKARHVRFRAPVALKCLKIPANLSAQERTEFFERFRAEGEVMFRLSSSIPEVVRPMAVDAIKLPDGRYVPFIALEWLEGETLKDVIVRRLQEDLPPIALAKAVEMLTPVARGLARAHRFPGPEGALAILHCDLKPDNLFVAKTPEGEVFKIFDFGIAKVRSAATRIAGGATNTDATNNMFTPAYAAPEQWTPDKYGQTGPWTDVFALALTLTELITQKPAIDGAPAAMLAQSLDTKKRPTPNKLGLGQPKELDAIFEKALAVDPKDRYQSIEDFWGELEEALRLPAMLGGGGRLSMHSMAPLPAWDAEPLLRPPSSNPPAAMPHSDPPARQPPGAPGADFPSLDLDLPRLDSPGGPPPAPPPQPHVAAPIAAPAVGVLDEEAFSAPAAAFDLAADVARPEPGPASASAQGPLGQAVDPFGASHVPPEEAPQGPSNRERLAAAATVAGAVATQAAGAAARGAKSLAQKAVEIDRTQVIKLDDPTTWIRPMRGPILALSGALLLTILAVVYNKATASTVKVVYISLPVFLAAIGFAVYRFVKLDKE